MKTFTSTIVLAAVALSSAANGFLITNGATGRQENHKDNKCVSEELGNQVSYQSDAKCTLQCFPEPNCSGKPYASGTQNTWLKPGFDVKSVKCDK